MGLHISDVRRNSHATHSGLLALMALAFVVLSCTFVPGAFAQVPDNCIGSNCIDGYTMWIQQSCQCCDVSGQLCMQSSEACTTINNCAVCTDPQVCDRCSGGYHWYDNVCVICAVPNCDSCTNNNIGTCDLCSTGYAWQAPGICTSDPGCRVSNCKTCSSANATSCTECNPGYAPNAVGMCRPTCAIANCEACYSGTTNDCQLCANGYTWNNNTCNPKNGCRIGHCKACSTTDNSMCAECDTGYTLSTSGYCTATQNCTPNCKDCSSDGSTCTQCNTGYTLVNGACVACTDANCNSCDANKDTCTACKNGYTVVNGKCSLVSACNVANCAQCMLLDKSKCSTCKNGYLLTTKYTCASQSIVDTTTTPNSLCLTAALVLLSALLCIA